MALTDRLSDTPKRTNGLPCSIGAVLEKLPPDEAEALNQMMFYLGWSQNDIYNALEAEGHIVGRQTINRHRSHSCRCFG